MSEYNLYMNSSDKTLLSHLQKMKQVFGLVHLFGKSVQTKNVLPLFFFFEWLYYMNDWKHKYMIRAKMCLFDYYI